MSLQQHIVDDLKIPSWACNSVSQDRFDCVTSNDWYQCLRQCWSQRCDELLLEPVSYDLLGRSDAKLMLSPSYSQCIPGWSRMTIIVIEKSSKLVISLSNVPLCTPGSKLPHTAKILSDTAQRSRQCLLSDATRRFSAAVHLTEPGVCQPQDEALEYSSCVRSTLCKLYGARPMLLNQPLNNGSDPSDSPSRFGDCGTSQNKPTQSLCHAGMMVPDGVIESDNAFFILVPFMPYSVADLLVFSPCRLSHTSKLFILYQILQSVRYVHSMGLSVGDLRLCDIAVNDRLWIGLPTPPMSFQCRFVSESPRAMGETQRDSVHKKADIRSLLRHSLESGSQVKLCEDESPRFGLVTHTVSSSSSDDSSFDLSLCSPVDLPIVVHKWVYGELSNLEYLLFLNRLAGRTTNDPNHYPIVPWTIDFSSPGDAGFRDLTRTKYRLNKGDEQLDLTFDMSNPESMMREPGQTPFHVSDFLSDITYYVYKARRTDKSVLCRLVRQRWVPAHYPASLERLYRWTPDECIPEFYTDPSLFTSIHDDLPDLELPTWAKDAGDFIQIHRSVLEGEQVTQNLHHWIDLTFGYKLSGKAAVDSKNVCLQLVDNHKNPFNHGVVQLFSCPHPPRRVQISALNILQPSATRSAIDTSSSLSMRTVVDALSSLEAVSEFSLRTVHALPPARLPTDSPALPPARLPTGSTPIGTKQRDHATLRDVDMCEAIRARDMQTVGCLIVELFHPSAAWCLLDGGNHHNSSRSSDFIVKRYNLVCNYLRHSIHHLHWSVRRAVLYLLNLSNVWNESNIDIESGSLFIYPSRGVDDLPPPDIQMLLHPIFRLILFPAYFESLHRYLLRYNHLCTSLLSSPVEDKGRIESEKVSLLAQYLTRMSSLLGADGLQLVIPYVLEQLTDLQASTSQSAWLLFHPVAQAIGPSEAAQYFLQPLMSIFDSEETSVKYLKIYHRSFISQLIVRFGLEVFLSSFSTLLVEAAACYKDFPSNSSNSVDNAIIDSVGATDTDVAQSNESDIPKMPDYDLDGELLVANGDFESDSISDTDVGNGHFGLSVSADEDDVGSAASASGVIDESSHDDKTPDGDTTSLQSDNARIDECTSLENLSGGQSYITGASEDKSNDVLMVDSVRPPCYMPSQNTSCLSSLTRSSDYNVSNIAAESLKWLADRLGPVLTTKFVSRNLLRMLTLCYIGAEQLQCFKTHKYEEFSLTGSCLVGDRNATHILDCLAFIVSIYGQQIIVLQYLQHASDIVLSLRRSDALSTRTEASIVACLTLILYMLPHMMDKTLVDVLQDSLLDDIIIPLIGVVSSCELSFPTGSAARCAAAHKLLDVMYAIGRRIGFCDTRRVLTPSLVAFFDAFSVVHTAAAASSCDNLAEAGNNSGGVTVDAAVEDSSAKDDLHELRYEVHLDGLTNQFTVDVERRQSHKRQSSLTAFKQHSLTPTQPDVLQSLDDNVETCQDKKKIFEELSETFTAELAFMAYIAFSQLAGSIHMADHLSNDDLIRNLCMEYEQRKIATGRSQRLSSHDGCHGDVYVEGNKLVIRPDSASPNLNVNAKSANDVTAPDAEQVTRRHLRGNWLAYWEHEVGRGDRDTSFQLKQISLQRFTGHTSSIRSICVLDSENSFVTASKDRTVKLWSLRNSGDGSASIGCQWSYSQHKKSVLSLAFLESVRLLASTDGHLHIWDPFVPVNIRQVSTSRLMNHGSGGSSNTGGLFINTVVPLPAPSSLLMTATNTDTLLRSVDVRTGKFVHELRTTVVPSGLIHGVTVSPDGKYVAVGFTTGLVSTLDLRTGLLLASWKAHEADILDIKSFENRRLITSSLDQTVAVWRPDDGKLMTSMKGFSEPVNSMCMYKDTLITASAGNRINVISSIDSMSESSSMKLKSDMVRGLLSCIAVLPLNRLLLLGTDSGDLRLVA